MNSVAPAFVKIDYISLYGAHVMTVPSVPILADALKASGFRLDLRGAEVDVDLAGAVADYVNVLKPFWPTSTTFTGFTAYTQSSPTVAPVPVYTGKLNIAGTITGEGISKAVQATWTFRADDFTISKLVMLDVPPPGSNFEKITSIGSSGAGHDLVAYWTSAATWVASRGGGRPNTFLQVAKTLNEKLRRAYGMN